MSISKQATKGHLIVGAVLVFLALCSLIAALIVGSGIFSFLVFFFGVWGGVEPGRYLEHRMSTREETASGQG
jgi:hypothetical protein